MHRQIPDTEILHNQQQYGGGDYCIQNNMTKQNLYLN